MCRDVIPRRVFADTGALLAMIVFPRDKSGGITLAGNVLELYQAGAFELVIGQVVLDELDEVLTERFPSHRLQAVSWLMPFTCHLVRRPTPAEIAAVFSFCHDPADAPIFASAIIARPDIVLSNDFRAFHTTEAKALWSQYQMTVESLYGLLCVFGQRERKDH